MRVKAYDNLERAAEIKGMSEGSGSVSLAMAGSSKIDPVDIVDQSMARNEDHPCHDNHSWNDDADTMSQDDDAAEAASIDQLSFSDPNIFGRLLQPPSPITRTRADSRDLGWTAPSISPPSDTTPSPRSTFVIPCPSSCDPRPRVRRATSPTAGYQPPSKRISLGQSSPRSASDPIPIPIHAQAPALLSPGPPARLPPAPPPSPIANTHTQAPLSGNRHRRTPSTFQTIATALSPSNFFQSHSESRQPLRSPSTQSQTLPEGQNHDQGDVEEPAENYDNLFPHDSLVKNIHRFMRFSSAAYGQKFLRIMGMGNSEYNFSSTARHHANSWAFVSRASRSFLGVSQLRRDCAGHMCQAKLLWTAQSV